MLGVNRRFHYLGPICTVPCVIRSGPLRGHSTDRTAEPRGSSVQILRSSRRTAGVLLRSRYTTHRAGDYPRPERNGSPCPCLGQDARTQTFLADFRARHTERSRAWER